MTPIPQTEMAAPRTTEGVRPKEKPDRETVDRFREALDRKSGKAGASKQDEKEERVGADRLSPLPQAGAQPSLVPVLTHDRPKQDKGYMSDECAEGATGSSAPAPRDATVVSALPPAAPAIDVAAFATLVARLDSGLPPSALSHLALPGDLWRADQVMIDQQAGGLSVTVDIGGQGDAHHESLNELEARLRARGMVATVSAADPNRIAEADSRIA
ncbi:hypothetical protein U5A82_19530 [Sphingobium sp. CR2-8]|uniref:hypothetical protein n=1 Tax=Sphingobium sp. CR2-8 TaxID=1306534 RepID=UPI002DBB1DE0|nr:hypothetical protein [Sphingobium sp. CR2-8]MEC3912585.1 hypothetical protein [Sphingobium sp. CR2-8]